MNLLLILSKANNKQKWCLGIFILLVGAGIFLTRPVSIKINTHEHYYGVLVQLIDREEQVLNTYIVDSNQTIELGIHQVINLILRSDAIRTIHPLLQERQDVLDFSILLKKKSNINLSCWCANKTYPKQHEFALVYRHFLNVNKYYVPNVSYLKRQKALLNHGKALYMLTAIANAHKGEARKWRKNKIRSMRKKISDIVGSLYRM